MTPTHLHRSMLPIGPLTLGKEGKHFIPPKQEWSAPDRVTNALAKGSYSQQEEWKNAAQRPGCLDFLKFRSRGTGC